MNKQELIDKLKNDLTAMSGFKGIKHEYDKGYEWATKQHLEIIANLDEPQKVVVPQYVADWYEAIKYDFEYSLYKLCIDFNKRELRDDLGGWFDSPVNKPIETLVKMKLYGYEVEKEKLYTVEIPNPNSKGINKIYLCKENNTGKVYLCKGNFNPSKNKNLKLTEAEIKKDFDWAWRFAKEVEE
jgi:hypothetical protein